MVDPDRCVDDPKRDQSESFHSIRRLRKLVSLNNEKNGTGAAEGVALSWTDVNGAITRVIALTCVIAKISKQRY